MNYDDPNLGAGLVTFILLAVAGVLLIQANRNHRQRMQFQIKLFLTAFVIRFASSLAIYQFGLINIIKDEDGSGWVIGTSFKREWERQGFGILDIPYLFSLAYGENHRGYWRMLGAFFMLTDTPARLPAAALNCFFGALTVVLVYRVARTLFSEWVAVRVGWWSCFFLSLILWSSQTLKEPVVILLETVALYGCIMLRNRGVSVRHLVLCGASIILVYPFRFYASYLAGGAVLATLLLPRISRGKKGWKSYIILLPLVILAIWLTGRVALHDTSLERYDLEYLERFRYYAAKEGSGVMLDTSLRTPAGAGLTLIYGAVHLMLAPFPWQWGGSFRLLLTIPEVLVWWWMFFAGVIPGLRTTLRHRFGDVLPLLLFILGLGVLYSLMFSNVGLAYRHRAQLLPWLFIFAAAGLEQRVLQRLAIRRTKMALIRNQIPAIARPRTD